MQRFKKQGLMFLALLVLTCLLYELYSHTCESSLQEVLSTKTGTPRQISQKQDKPLLCHNLGCGRLGNQIFEYASILGVAATTNRTPFFMNGGLLRGKLKYFPQPSPNDAKTQERCRKAKVILDGIGGQYHRNLINLEPGIDYVMGQCLQSWMYFADIRDEIRKAVTFSDDIVEKASKVMQDLRARHPNSTFVGIHNRRGDMATKKYSDRGYIMPGPDYFLKAMTLFRQRFARVVFIVVSNDYDWSLQHIIPINNDVVFLRPDTAEVDMQILSMTDHMIMTLGTFGWWGAYKIPGKPTVVFFSNFAKKQSTLSGWFTPGLPDLMPPSWIAM